MRATRRFTSEEDEYIRQHHGRLNNTSIAKHLGRSPGSIISRKVTLGLHAPNRHIQRFTPAEDAVIRESLGQRSGYEIAQALGRRPSAIYQRANALGISFAPVLRAAKPRLKEGYWWIPLESNGRRTWRMEHRYVMEQHVGRPLEAHEQVHHVDLDPGANREDNLYLCRNAAAHMALHNHLGRVLAHPTLVKRLMERGFLRFDATTGSYHLCDIDKF